MTIVITGAGGQLGSVLTEHCRSAGVRAIALDRRDLDVTRREAAEALAAWCPTAIVNCSAYNDVDGAELDPAAARAVNVDAVRHLANAATAAGAAFVHYSTDFVFD